MSPIKHFAIGIECRQNDIPTQQRVTAERAMNKRLEGGCQVPIAGFAQISEQGLNFYLALVFFCSSSAKYSLITCGENCLNTSLGENCLITSLGENC